MEYINKTKGSSQHKACQEREKKKSTNIYKHIQKSNEKTKKEKQLINAQHCKWIKPPTMEIERTINIFCLQPPIGK